MPTADTSRNTVPPYEAFPHHPNDATCRDCVSFARCSNLFSNVEIAWWRTCDWSPTRFRLPVVEEVSRD